MCNWLSCDIVVILDSIAFVGPSVTTYQGLNPGYRIYEVDGDYVNSSRVLITYLIFHTVDYIYKDKLRYYYIYL